ncbi:hypothetical protein FQA39_LY00066 [Lamprigera yunnana]|nr:hypothetical protein FQA39_LY00066 [Lamprigera yunnana]
MDNIPDDLKPPLVYVEDTYIERPNRRGNYRKQPLLPIELCGVLFSRHTKISNHAHAPSRDTRKNMDFQEIDLKRRIQIVRNSTRKKFSILKRQRADVEKQFCDTYRPIIELLTSIMTKMDDDDGNSEAIQNRKIEEDKEVRGKKKKKMVARSLDSDNESGNISRDIGMPSLPATPIRSYLAPGFKRWLLSLTPSSLSSTSLPLTPQRQTSPLSSSSSSQDLIHRKYHPLLTIHRKAVCRWIRANGRLLLRHPL